MSDFDKEAERERLREKYENDAEDREQTQRMSQLLLRGATMTNQHCDTCGTPIFRYDGQEFCPECHDEAAEGAADAAVEGGAEAAAEAVEDVGDDQTGDATQQAAGGDARSDAAATRERDSPDAGRAADARGATSETRDARGVHDAGDESRTDAGYAGGNADVADARASLVRTLGSMARRAEATDDPRRAKELLAAAREAAEAVAALDR